MDDQFIRDAIATAIDLCNEDGERRLVGLLDEEGECFMAWPLERDATAMLGFTPGWIVTPGGHVLPYLRAGQTVREN